MKRRRNIFIRMWRQRKIPGLRPLGRIRRIMTKFYGVFGPIPKPDKWVFIVGCGSSGSTLLQKIISSHPLVGSMPMEGQYYTDQLKRYKPGEDRRIWTTVPEYLRMDEKTTGANPNKLKRQWGGRFNDWTRPILLEKNPGNTLRMRWLQEHFENSHFIGIIRNGFAVAESSRRKVTHDIRTSAKRWANINKIMLADFEHLERTKLIRYETLTEKPEECIREI